MAVTEIMSVRRAVLPSSMPQRTKQVAMTIAPEAGGTALNIPYAPMEVQHSNLIAEYVTVPRPGLLENVVYSNVQRPRMQFELKIHDKKVTTSGAGAQTQLRAISVIQALQGMARTGKRVRIAYGALESGIWYIIGMSLKSTRRDPVSDEITSADVSMECVRGDSTISGTGTGPVTGGATTTTKAPSAAATVAAQTISKVTARTAAAPATRFHVVKSGETLWGISLKYYGTGSRWHSIGDANKIKDARKLKIGLKLRIP